MRWTRAADAGELMTPELAVAITDMRLVQTAGLLEWLLENHGGSEALRRSLESVLDARQLVSTFADDALSDCRPERSI